MDKKKFFSTRNITYLSVLTAFIVVFQLVSSLVPLPGGAALNLTLVPIVLGGIILGSSGGAFLGLTFAVIVVIMSIAKPEGMMIFIIESPSALVFFIFSTLVRGFLVGIVPALVFKLISKKNVHVATVVSSAVAPITNTAVFILSSLALFGMLPDSLDMNALEFFKYLVLTVAGVNFLIEFAINIILSPAIYSVVRIVGARIRATGQG